jgi:hypothetical protein
MENCMRLFGSMNRKCFDIEKLQIDSSLFYVAIAAAGSFSTLQRHLNFFCDETLFLLDSFIVSFAFVLLSAKYLIGSIVKFFNSFLFNFKLDVYAFLIVV